MDLLSDYFLLLKNDMDLVPIAVVLNEIYVEFSKVHVNQLPSMASDRAEFCGNVTFPD